MASLWKHPQSRFWTACFTDATGKQRKRSTKATDRKTAAKIAAQYEEVARRKRTARHTRKVIASLHHELTSEGLVKSTVRQFTTSWIDQKRAETAPSTLSFYDKTCRKFLEFLGSRADEDIAEVTPDDIVRFRNAAAKTLAAKTVNHDLKCVRMLFKTAKRDNAIADDPTEFVELVRREADSEKRPFTVPEIKAVLSVADQEWQSLIRFGIYTGQRLADLATLMSTNIDLQRNELRLVTRKTGKRLILPLAAPLRRHVEAMGVGIEPNVPLHPRAYAIAMRQRRTGTLSNQFAELLARAGLRKKPTHKKVGEGRDSRRSRSQLSFHTLRHTATTLLHDAGIPLAVAQQLIGHDSEEMHRHYINVGREALVRAAAALPDI
jgi:integrase